MSSESSGSISPKSELCWDAFPAPPPGSETWTPDPDSIPKPNTIPDPRFTRDPYKDIQREIAREKYKMFNDSGHVASSFKSGGPQPVSTRGALQTAVRGKPASWFTDVIAKNGYSVTSAFKESAPAWAAPIQKALAEEAAQKAAKSTISSAPALELTPPLQALEASKKDAPKSVKTEHVSIPPHLRRNAKTAAEARRSTLDPAAKIYQPVSATSPEPVDPVSENGDNSEERLSDEELALKLAISDLGVDDAQEGLQLQEEMLKEYKDDVPASTVRSILTSATDNRHRDHSHYLKVRLVTNMEEDLDLSKRATKRELMAMSDDAIDKYLMKVYSAHEHWWEAEQRLCSNGASQSN